MASLWARYNHLLVTKPLRTKGLTGGTLFATGDLIAQYIDGTLQSPNGYNPKRTAINFFWSSCVFTPIGHQWFAKALPKLFPTPSLKHTLSKIALDQSLFAPFICSLYLSYSTIVRGGSLEDAQNKVKDNFWTVMKRNWMLWPAVQFIAFRFVPIPLQMPMFNCAALVWGCYLAIIGGQQDLIKAQEAAALAAQQLTASTSTQPIPTLLTSTLPLTSVPDLADVRKHSNQQRI